MVTFSEHDLGDVVRFEVVGRLDSAAVDNLEAPFTASVRKGAGDVLVDLAQVDFVGSLAIRMFIAAARVLQRAGRTMMFTNPQPPVMDVFETVAITDLIPIVADAEAARALRGA